MGEQPKESLADQAYEAIYGRILRCELVPGDRISERKIATQLNLGLAPVRAALARLAARGIVDSTPRVGYTVHAFTLKYINDFFAAWKIMGPNLIREALIVLTPAQAAAIRQELDQAEAKGRRLSPEEAWVNFAETAFDGLIGILNNSVIDDFYRRIRFDMHRLFILALRAAGTGSGLAFEGDDMNWIFAEDPDAAAEAVRRVLIAVHREVVATLVTSGAVESGDMNFAGHRTVTS